GTLASMVAAPLAVVAALLWTGQRERRRLLAPGVVAGLGLLLFAVIHWQAGGRAGPANESRSLLDLLHGVVFQLGWPSGLPGAAAVLQVPWLIHALRLRGRADATATDRIIFALGLWNLAHAVGLALARSGGTEGYVSRYGDLLFIGTLAGILALARLVPAPGRARWPFMAGATLWGALVIAGLWQNATEGHAAYFHQTAAQSNQVRRDALLAYLERGDPQPMEQKETRWVLTNSPELVRPLLDRPDFRALLPASVNPAGDSALGRLNRALQARWPWWLLGGFALLGTGLVLTFSRPTTDRPLPELVPTADRWPGWAALAVALACTGGLFLWSNPLVFSREARWTHMLGGDAALTNITFDFTVHSPLPPERLQGAAPLSPPELRNRFHGTAPEGPGWTGTVLSSPFTLSQPWLVVPFAGYPTGDGNGLRLRLLDAEGIWQGEELSCQGPNQEGIAYWTIDVTAHRGRQARLVLYDGRTEDQAWIAVAPPIPTDRPNLAVDLTQRLQRENQSRLHATLAVLALAAYLGAFVSWRNRRIARVAG
ncbi:MAG: hypothetical protein QG602_284, partial [Verrucomicrobiota bacterium]|nr:hypothetical protein [Verrucomicrobiota bacterium]